MRLPPIATRLVCAPSCKSVDVGANGCCPVTGGLPVTEIQVDIDPDRELEKIHSLFLTHMERLDAVQGG